MKKLFTIIAIAAFTFSCEKPEPDCTYEESQVTMTMFKHEIAVQAYEADPTNSNYFEESKRRELYYNATKNYENCQKGSPVRHNTIY